MVQATMRGEIAPAGGFHSGDGCSRSNCGGGRNSFAISWDGKIMPCVTNAGISIPLDGITLAEGWQKLKDQTEKLELPTECIQCPYQTICNACPATIYNEAGSYNHLSTYTCSVIKEHYMQRVQLLKAHMEKTK